MCFPDILLQPYLSILKMAMAQKKYIYIYANKISVYIYIYTYTYTQYLVGGIPTPLKNDGVRQYSQLHGKS